MPADTRVHKEFLNLTFQTCEGGQRLKCHLARDLGCQEGQIWHHGDLRELRAWSAPCRRLDLLGLKYDSEPKPLHQAPAASWTPPFCVYLALCRASCEARKLPLVQFLFL